MKKQIAIALSIALMGLPLSSTVTLADTSPTVTITDTTTTQPATDSTTDATTTQPATDTTTDTTTTQPATDTTTDTTTTQPATDGTTDQGTSPVVDQNGNTVDPGTTPDSPLYWLSELIQKLQVILTFDPAQKADLVQQQALQDLAAANKMTDEGKADQAQTALTHYAAKVAQAQDFLDKVKDPTSDQYKALSTALSNTNANNIQTLSGLLDKLPANASQHVALNIVRSMEKAVKKMNKEQQKQLRKGMEPAINKLDDNKLDEETKTAVKNFINDLNTGVQQANEQDQTQTDAASATSTTTTNQAIVQKEQEKGEHGKLQRQEHAPKFQINTNQVQTKKDQDEEQEQAEEQDVQKSSVSSSPTNMNQQPGNGYGRMKSNGKGHKEY